MNDEHVENDISGDLSPIYNCLSKPELLAELEFICAKFKVSSVVITKFQAR